MYKQTVENFTAPGGCQDKLLKCRELAAERDPRNLGADEEVNAICLEVRDCYNGILTNPYLDTNNVWMFFPRAPRL
jgi:hypothetical protein